jgi:hypothetical protein
MSILEICVPLCSSRCILYSTVELGYNVTARLQSRSNIRTTHTTYTAALHTTTRLHITLNTTCC